ncbi:MAG: terpene cyclase/mutase family protein, partial [Planctomycetes bacterium]|nr:terpene cyclase/mutase family protein [Planctomycetota bacterium]
MAFLGAGNTPQKGPYKSRVERGLKFLLKNQEETNEGGWFRGEGTGTYYIQAICTIALCEAYTMTKDPDLRRPAQLAVDLIINGQDPEGGGWRYFPRAPGDTSVVGWQVMALTSARIAELQLHPRVLPKVNGFLQRVSVPGSGMYGYMNSSTSRPSTTAVGILCQMYLGKDKSNRVLVRGMNHLSDWGPNGFDMYYTYYGTMAMHHWGGVPWERWNNSMRKMLVESQVQEGDAAGSWMTDRSMHSEKGGRLYTTCLSILTLEVYYRYLPLYHKHAAQADDDDVPLDEPSTEPTAKRE